MFRSMSINNCFFDKKINHAERTGDITLHYITQGHMPSPAICAFSLEVGRRLLSASGHPSCLGVSEKPDP